MRDGNRWATEYLRFGVKDDVSTAPKAGLSHAQRGVFESGGEQTGEDHIAEERVTKKEKRRHKLGVSDGDRLPPARGRFCVKWIAEPRVRIRCEIENQRAGGSAAEKGEPVFAAGHGGTEWKRQRETAGADQHAWPGPLFAELGGVVVIEKKIGKRERCERQGPQAFVAEIDGAAKSQRHDWGKVSQFRMAGGDDTPSGSQKEDGDWSEYGHEQRVCLKKTDTSAAALLGGR